MPMELYVCLKTLIAVVLTSKAQNKRSNAENQNFDSAYNTDSSPGLQSRIPNPAGSRTFFSIPKSRDWMAPIPGFRD
jgi:hypothetical protein